MSSAKRTWPSDSTWQSEMSPDVPRPTPGGRHLHLGLRPAAPGLRFELTGRGWRGSTWAGLTHCVPNHPAGLWTTCLAARVTNRCHPTVPTPVNQITQKACKYRPPGYNDSKVAGFAEEKWD